MIIKRLTEISPKIIEAFEKLMPQLNTSVPIPTFNELYELTSSESTIVFMGELDGEIIGTLTLVINKIPSGDKVWIEDVIVDESVRGKGFGRKLIEHAIVFLRSKGYSSVNLTSNPTREAANKMYQQIGFELRETNVYRMHL